MAVSKLTDAEHDAFVKAVDAGVDPKKIRMQSPRAGGSSKRRSMLRSQPGWAQLLTNDLGRILQGQRHLEDLLEQLVSHFRRRRLTELEEDSRSGSSGFELLVAGKLSESEYFGPQLSSGEDLGD